MTILEASKKLQSDLLSIYDEREANAITNFVLENITGFSKSERLVHKTDSLSESQLVKFEKFSKELSQQKPVQYVLHEAWFAGLKFYVDENVLIPRPETEELVDWILTDVKSEMNSSPVKILDIGTGSGCIPISIKKKLKEADIYALDINKKSIKIAKKNADMNDVNINFFAGDILNFTSLPDLPIFDVIVSNPPYIKQSERKEMQPNVLLHEPEIALFVPDENPLIFYNAIVDFALQQLNKENGRIYFEMNETLGKEVVALLALKGFNKVVLRKDLQGKDRMISATFKQ